MKARTRSQSTTKVDVWYEVARFAQGAGMAMAAVIGIWATACLVSGLAGHGISGLLRGFITAVTGG